MLSPHRQMERAPSDVLLQWRARKGTTPSLRGLKTLDEHYVTPASLAKSTRHRHAILMNPALPSHLNSEMAHETREGPIPQEGVVTLAHLGRNEVRSEPPLHAADGTWVTSIGQRDSAERCASRLRQVEADAASIKFSRTCVATDSWQHLRPTNS